MSDLNRNLLQENDANEESYNLEAGLALAREKLSELESAGADEYDIASARALVSLYCKELGLEEEAAKAFFANMELLKITVSDEPEPVIALSKLIDVTKDAKENVKNRALSFILEIAATMQIPEKYLSTLAHVFVKMAIFAHEIDRVDIAEGLYRKAIRLYEKLNVTAENTATHTPQHLLNAPSGCDLSKDAMAMLEHILSGNATPVEQLMLACRELAKILESTERQDEADAIRCKLSALIISVNAPVD